MRLAWSWLACAVAVARAAHLTPAQRDAFFEDGLVVLGKLLDEAAVAALTEGPLENYLEASWWQWNTFARSLAGNYSGDWIGGMFGGTGRGGDDTTRALAEALSDPSGGGGSSGAASCRRILSVRLGSSPRVSSPSCMHAASLGAAETPRHLLRLRSARRSSKRQVPRRRVGADIRFRHDVEG